MTTIRVNATFPKVSSADLAAFRHAAATALEVARSEPGVLQYEWFFDDTESVCVVQETYQDVQALLAHAAALGETLTTLSQLGGGCEIAMFGDPPSGLIEPAAPVRRSIFRASFQRK